jgi:hypothetical protein
MLANAYTARANRITNSTYTESTDQMRTSVVVVARCLYNKVIYILEVLVFYAASRWRQ